MEPSREEAKGAIVTRSNVDPDLDQALQDAATFRLDHLKETNRHQESMRGAVARLFGRDGNTPSYIAAVGMLFSLIGCVVLWIVAGQKPEQQAAIWMQHAERLLAFAATCLAFIFGKGIKD